jgi:hypothetical protein
MGLFWGYWYFLHFLRIVKGWVLQKNTKNDKNRNIHFSSFSANRQRGGSLKKDKNAKKSDEKKKKKRHKNKNEKMRAKMV